MIDVVAKTSERVFIPLTVGGGINSIQDIRSLLKAGADKISINTPALNNPNLISELSNSFGSQCVVIGMDIKIIDAEAYLFAKTGSERTAFCTNKKPLDWLQEVQDLGAGEVVINAMGKDGVRDGYDIELLQSLETKCSIPMIASGGAGGPDDFINVFEQTNVDGALAAGIFHRNEFSVGQIKKALKTNKVNVRI